MPTLRGNPWAILSALSLAYFMAQLDIAVLTVAVPSITADLGASVDQVMWAVGAYVLVLAVSLITAGRLGDLYGRKRIFQIGVAVFTVCSLLCALADTPGELIAARALQGLGAALITPQTMALLVEVFPAERRGTALGVRGAVGAAAAVAGPVVGGLLVTGLDWRWVFFVNLPIGLLLLLSSLVIPNDSRKAGPARLDLGGMLLLTAALLGLAFVISQGEAYDWQGWIWALLALSAVVFAGFLRQQQGRQERDPLVPFSLFRDRDYTLMTAFSVTVSMTVIGLVLVLSVFFQSVLGFSALKAGLVIMPASLCSMALSTVAGRLSDRFPGKYLLLVGVGLTIVGLLWSAAVMQEGADWPVFVGPMCVIGLGNAFLFTPLVAVALHGVRPVMAGAASGVLVTTLQIGSMIGTALIGTLLRGADGGTPTVADSRTAMVLLAVVAALAGAACLAARGRQAEPEPEPGKTEPGQPAVELGKDEEQRADDSAPAGDDAGAAAESGEGEDDDRVGPKTVGDARP